MKPTLLTGITVVMMMLSTVVFADKDHHKNDASPQSMSGMPMMDMAAMHQHMAKMQKTMEQIQGSKDMKERQALMQQHMQEMHKSMGMMSGDMAGKMPGNMKEPMGKPGLNTMMQNQKMMAQRMNMMQGMMGQMMEHMMQQQKMDMGKQ